MESIAVNTSANINSNPVKFYLRKMKNRKYYVQISIYNKETKKNFCDYKSLKTTNKNQAITNFNKFVNSYLNFETEIQINRNINIQDFFQEISNHLKTNLEKSTLNIYNLTVRKFIELVGNRILKMINVKDIEEFKEKKLMQNVSRYEVNKEFSCLKSIFNIAIRLNYLIKNPCKYVKKFRIEDSKIKVFTDYEMELLLSSIKDKTLLNIVKFGLWSGLRLNEILNLKYSNINISDSIIEINNTKEFKTKTKKNKIVIINDKLKNLLLEIINEGNPTCEMEINNVFELNKEDKYLFTLNNRNRNISKNYISHLFKAECRKLNLNEDLHFHSIRHTYISNLINKGTPINFVKELVGHANIATTMQYITLNKDELKKYANRV